jgi:hypothetical protein
VVFRLMTRLRSNIHPVLVSLVITPLTIRMTFFASKSPTAITPRSRFEPDNGGRATFCQ